MEEPATTGTGDAALISRVRDGDVSAYGVLYERHVAAARGLARHLTGGSDAAAAEDAVQDAFTKVLGVLRRGAGPDTGFRPYLLTAVRRAVYDRRRADRRLHRTDRIEEFDEGVPFEDPALADLERSMIVRAYRSLPDRWQEVLWHTEVEGTKPAEVAALLGLTANGAAALAYRAREGLRQAYLQMHLAGLGDRRRECRPTLERLGPFVRGALAARESRRIQRHLDGCAGCKALHAELADLNTALREGLGPLVLGTASSVALASKGGLFTWLRYLPRRQQQVLAGGGAVAVAAAVAATAMVLVSDRRPVRPAHDPPAAVQAPPRPPAAEPAPEPAVPRPPAPSRPAPPGARPVVVPAADRPAPRPTSGVPAPPVSRPPKKHPHPHPPRPVHRHPRCPFVRVTAGGPDVLVDVAVGTNIHVKGGGEHVAAESVHVRTTTVRVRAGGAVHVKVRAGAGAGVPRQVVVPVFADARFHGRLKTRSRAPYG
ncbi:sigma-70 family RNA polymerase sigma factor [Actinomadura sp. LD22]|uniref:Sigma-70 family RNA polymerase sigma factor n=1 Tax=Actinomadura physcomitrii TaxID=2650748 RepID=A0A6I4MWW9_9ACTN|nr:sigma-70 family RNA polymerase sigma factor [Actinomadura physcomitrii]MWA06866.1 sigma-70 family RNA polymerase sigma factor [Actinomadura physcomitrii]